MPTRYMLTIADNGQVHVDKMRRGAAESMGEGPWPDANWSPMGGGAFETAVRMVRDDYAHERQAASRDGQVAEGDYQGEGGGAA